MIFPEGIEYDRKTDQYRTLRVNSFFSYIPVITRDVDNKKTGKFRVKTKNSGLVLETGQIFRNELYERRYSNRFEL